MPKPRTFCVIDDCGKPCRGHQRCPKHYSQWRRKYGTSKTHCSVRGCKNPTEAIELCQKHYSRWIRHGTTSLIIREKKHCKIPDCSHPYYAHGYCSLHYQRWRKYSDPLRTKQRPKGSGSFWDGYKFIYDNGTQRPEHRIIIERYLGRPLLNTEIVHHRDHNGLNNAIENLQLMTRREHMVHHRNEFEHLRREGLKKCRGGRNPKAKLTEAQVRLIRSIIPFPHYREALAKRFGTTVSNIKTIRSGYSWRYI